MKPAFILPFALLLSTAGVLSAQQGGGVTVMEGQATPAAPACPIDVTARHLPDGDMVRTGIAHPKGIGQALHLTLSGYKKGLIAEAEIVIRGWTPKGRAAQARSTSEGDAVRSMRIRLAPGDLTPNSSQSSVADLWVPGLTAITSIQIREATFANGSKWFSSGDQACRAIAPDLLMLVRQ